MNWSNNLQTRASKQVLVVGYVHQTPLQWNVFRWPDGTITSTPTLLPARGQPGYSSTTAGPGSGSAVASALLNRLNAPIAPHQIATLGTPVNVAQTRFTRPDAYGMSASPTADSSNFGSPVTFEDAGHVFK